MSYCPEESHRMSDAGWIEEGSPSLQRPYTHRFSLEDDVSKSLPSEHWCVLLESKQFLLACEIAFEQAGFDMKQLDTLDGSIGKSWSKYRIQENLAGQTKQFNYKYPTGDPRKEVLAKCYPDDEVEYFKVWLRTDYLQNQFDTYIRKKYKKANKEQVSQVIEALKNLLKE
jgi:hypothetical protein